MKKIEFSINLTLLKKKDDVIQTLFDYDKMKYYQMPPLKDYKIIKGADLQDGTLRKLYYSDDDSDIMYEGVVKNELPKGITFVQKYKSVKVILKHSFTSLHEHTLWKVDYTFEVSDDAKIDRMGLIKQLTLDMKAFKGYIEND